MTVTAGDVGMLVIADEVGRLIERTRALVAKGVPAGVAARAVLARCEPAQITALAWAALAAAVTQDDPALAAAPASAQPPTSEVRSN